MKGYLGVTLSVALGALLLSGAVRAQEFMCGSSACTTAQITGNAIFTSPISGIDNLVVDGSTYDMAFSNTMKSPFSLKTGLDAADVLGAFIGKQQGFFDPGPGFGPVSEYIQTTANIGGNFDVVVAFWSVPTKGVTTNFGEAPSCAIATCTTWTKVSAPELDATSWAGASTLLLGAIAVIVGRVKRA